MQSAFLLLLFFEAVMSRSRVPRVYDISRLTSRIRIVEIEARRREDTDFRVILSDLREIAMVLRSSGTPSAAKRARTLTRGAQNLRFIFSHSFNLHNVVHSTTDTFHWVAVVCMVRSSAQVTRHRHASSHSSLESKQKILSWICSLIRQRLQK